MIRATAPAKVNLCLHVTGRRDDGYHLLDSLVVFTELGDQISVTPGPTSLTLTGPEGASLQAEGDNLVLRAAAMMGVTAAITLDKHLPVASGIGGGSADAAATLRALAAMTGRDIPQHTEQLGADVPMCIPSTPLRVRGIGEDLTPLPDLPDLWLVLVNPRVGVSTPSVFRALASRDNAPLPEHLPPWHSGADLAAFLRDTRNDLEPPARAMVPEIDHVLNAVSETSGCLMARMSGSGATCFGMYDRQDLAAQAARDIAAAAPHWWVQHSALRPSNPPQVMRATT